MKPPAPLNAVKSLDYGSKDIVCTSSTRPDVLNESLLKDYQKLGRDFLYENEAAALILKMSAGKTVITLSALTNLFADFSIRGALIVAPLRVCHLVWPQEVATWSHTRWMTVSSITGTPRQRLDALKKDADIYLINYENLLWLFDTLAQFREFNRGEWPFDVIAFDELTNMKGYSSKRFKRFKKLIPRFKYRWGLTGTIMPNSYFDLFAEYYCLDGGKRLGSSFYSYRLTYFYPTDYQQYNWVPHEGAEEQILNKVADITLEVDHDAGLPDTITGIIEAELTPKAMKQYKEFESEMFLAIEDEEIEALNEASKSMRCHQLCQGAIYTDEEHNWMEVHTAKFDALEEILEETGPTPTIIYYYYKHDLERLKAYLSKRLGKNNVHRICDLGSLKTEAALQDFLKKWEAGYYLYVLAHPGSAGHGLNLQFGGSTIIWWSLPFYRLDLILQANARLVRTHQQNTVAIYYILALGTIDFPMYNAILGKEDRQINFTQAIREYRTLLSA